MQLDVYGEPWGIDSPAAEQNLSRRVKTATSIAVEDPILMTLDDPQLFQHPWIYIVEPGALRLTDSEAANLREFLLRGGTAMLDDFHGPYEWDSLERQLRKVFPDRRITEITPDHAVSGVFTALDAYPQVAGIGRSWPGTWARAAVPHLRTILTMPGGRCCSSTEHGHGRRLGVVQRRGEFGLSEVHLDGLSHGDQRSLLADALTRPTPDMSGAATGEKVAEGRADPRRTEKVIGQTRWSKKSSSRCSRAGTA
jgi:hypothetical protein